MVDGIFAAGAALLVLAGLLSALRTWWWTRGTVLAEGEVTGNLKHSSRSGHGARATHPIVSFTATDGRAIQFEDGVGATFGILAEGTVVPVRYRAEDPNRARVATPLRLWSTALALAGFGLVLLVVLVA